MQIRFLQTTPSDRPEYPFQAGQVIDLPRLTADAKRWIAEGVAYLVQDEPEAAVMSATPERAVLPRARARGKR